MFSFRKIFWFMLLVVLVVIFLSTTGCAAKRKRIFVTGLFETHELMDTAYRKLEAEDQLYREKKRPNRLAQDDIRNAGFVPYVTKEDGSIQHIKNVNVLKGYKAFEEVFGENPLMFNSFTPLELADEKSLWTVEAYHDERVSGEEPFIYINTEETKPNSVETWYIFVTRLDKSTGRREVIMLSKEDKSEQGEDSVSAPLRGILGGMGRIVGGGVTGLSKGF